MYENEIIATNMEEPSSSNILKHSKTYSSSSWISLNKIKKTLEPDSSPAKEFSGDKTIRQNFVFVPRTGKPYGEGWNDLDAEVGDASRRS